MGSPSRVEKLDGMAKNARKISELPSIRTTREAMLRDWGSWDQDFRDITKEIRSRLIAMLGRPGFDCVPMQGSGTYRVEAMLGTFAPKDRTTLVLANGAYGLRAAKCLEVMGRPVKLIDKGDYLPPRTADIEAAFEEDPSISHVVAIHCETSSGILNPLNEISDAVAAGGRKLLVDSMSAFGAVPVDGVEFEAIVSSANKCIEGVPGFGFVLAPRDLIANAAGHAHSLSLDVHDQWANMERSGQWRFTPPTHTVAAFLEALNAHDAEGGVAARGARYAENRDTLVAGMRGLGFETLLADRWLSPIITTFFTPADPAFDFQRFYDILKREGFIIYPGKLTVVDSFRIGHIGRVTPAVMVELVDAVRVALTEMGVKDASPPQDALAERQNLTD